MTSDGPLAECVVNVSEGTDPRRIAAIGRAAGPALLDIHSDRHHHRSVLTLGGPLASVEEAARNLTEAAVAAIDLSDHHGVHPRLGAVDVVPFVPLAGWPDPDSGFDRIIGARDRFAAWAGASLDLPCFLYGPERSLPDIRRTAFRTLAPDTGPSVPHPTAGAAAVGARRPLVAYNVWVGSPGVGPGHPSALSVARSVASGLRGPSVRTLGLDLGPDAQVSSNLLDPEQVTVADVYDAVLARVEAEGLAVQRTELVGLIPRSALDAVPRHRWVELDLAEDRTVEARLAEAGHPVGTGPPPR